MGLETWVAIGALLGVLLSIGALILHQGSSLRAEIGTLRTTVVDGDNSLRAAIAEGDNSLRAEISALRTAMTAGDNNLQASIEKGDESLRAEIRTFRTEIRVDLHQQGARIDTLEGRIHDHTVRLQPYMQPVQGSEAAS